MSIGRLLGLTIPIASFAGVRGTGQANVQVPPLATNDDALVPTVNAQQSNGSTVAVKTS